MKLLYTIPAFFILFSFHFNNDGPYSEGQLIGSWKHFDVVNRLGAHATIELEPFDLTLRSDHRFEMTGQGMVSKGSWSLQKEVLQLNIESTADRRARIQKLYVTNVTADTLVLEIKDFKLKDGLLVVMHRKE